MVKVLIAGATNGRIGILAERVRTLNESKHGPFDGVLCTGEFFAPHSTTPSQPTEEDGIDVESYLTGNATFPIPLYFITGHNGHPSLPPDGGKVCHNLFFLGKAGLKVIDTLGGLRVAYLSGTSLLNQSTDPEHSSWQYSDVDVEALAEIGDEIQKTGRQTLVDILLTCDTPLGLPKDVLNSDGQQTSSDVAKICCCLAPRYHFVQSNQAFAAAPPFINGSNQVKPALFTRLIALRQVSSESSKDKTNKWIHALALEPLASSSQPQEPPTMCKPNPFIKQSTLPPPTSQVDVKEETETNVVEVKRDGPLTAEQIARITAEEAQVPQQHFYAVSKPRRNRPREDTRAPKRRKHKKYIVAPRGDCWYCLASPSCETHLIVSLSEDVFVSLPRGGLSAQHCQIIPVSHEPCLGALDNEMLEQVIQFKISLVDYFASFGCAALFFERSFVFEKAMQRHAFLEVIPIPKAALAVVAQTIEEQARRANVSFDIQLPPPAPGSMEGLGSVSEKDGLAGLKAYMQEEHADDVEDVEYMFIQVSEGAVPPRLFKVPKDASQDERRRLPLYFGRTVACVLLNCLERINWKGCVVPKEMEERLATDFKQGYKPFDPFKTD